MKAFIAVTDRDWYEFLRRRPNSDEVNFWQPGGGRQFRALNPGQCRPGLQAPALGNGKDHIGAHGAREQ